MEYHMGKALNNVFETLLKGQSSAYEGIVPTILQRMHFSTCEFVDQRSKFVPRPCTNLRWTRSNHYCEYHSKRYERQNHTRRQGARPPTSSDPRPTAINDDTVLHRFAPNRSDPNDNDFISDDDIDIGEVNNMEVDDDTADVNVAKDIERIRQNIRADSEKDKEKPSE